MEYPAIVNERQSEQLVCSLAIYLFNRTSGGKFLERLTSVSNSHLDFTWEAFGSNVTVIGVT